MFSKLTARAPREFACPDCGEKSVLSPNRNDQVIACVHCGIKASAADWMAGARDQKFVGRADQPPVTNIRRESSGRGVIWHIPAKGKFGFFMLFGSLWCLITAMVSGGFLLTFLSGKKIEGDMPGWVLVLFFAVFWMVGLTALYLGIREKWLQHRLSVAGGALMLRREMFGRHRDIQLPVSEIRSVEQKEFYQQNYKAVYGIEIRGQRGKVRFGSGLSPEEKAWLVADLREVIFGPRPAHQPITRRSHPGHFSVEIPHARKQLWPIAILLLLIGASFIFVGLKFLDRSPPPRTSPEPAIIAGISRSFALLDNGFQGLWLLMAGAMAVGGLCLCVRLLWGRGTVRKLEGNPSQIALRAYRGGRVVNEKIFPRGKVADIRASNSGHVSGRTMKRVELIVADKAERLVTWVEADAADALVGEVRARL